MTTILIAALGISFIVLILYMFYTGWLAGD